MLHLKTYIVKNHIYEFPMPMHNFSNIFLFLNEFSLNEYLLWSNKSSGLLLKCSTAHTFER